ncbi:MAG: WD domain protein [Peltula sp. TS41687]|nr:MAG: WD domain protein [Peltula sp. TS41687]
MDETEEATERPIKRMRLENNEEDDTIKEEHSPVYQSGNEGEGAGQSEPRSPAAVDDAATMPRSPSELDTQTPGHRYDSAEEDEEDRARHKHHANGDNRQASDEQSIRASPTTTTPPPANNKLEIKIQYRQRLILRGHKQGVSAVKYSPDGRWIASSSADATIKIWDAVSGKPAQTLEGHLGGISAIAWSPDSKTLASGSDDKSIRLWDISSGKPYPTPLLGHHNHVYSLSFSPKGNMLVSGSHDESVMLWNVRSARPMRSLPAHSDPVGGVDFVHDGTLVVSCASDGLMCVSIPLPSSVLQISQGCRGASQQHRAAAIAKLERRNIRRIWDTATGQCLRTLVHEDNPPVVSVRFSPNGKYVLAWTLDSCVRLWDYVEGRCVKTYQGHLNVRYSVGGCFFARGGSSSSSSSSSRSRTVAAGEVGGGGQEEEEEEEEEDEDGGAGGEKAYIVSGSEDGCLVVWEVGSKSVVQRITGGGGGGGGGGAGTETKGHEGVVLGVDSHPFRQGELVSCGADGTVRVWTDESVIVA